MDRSSSAERGYGYRWQRAREGYLRKHPLCRDCQQRDRITPATVVDHIKPHRGDMQLFWDPSNWQPLCATCHSAHKQRAEKSGRVAGTAQDGRPLDPGHPWNRQGEGG